MELNSCVHCGICLSACPTYRVLKEETDSPRGRIYLLAALEQGRADAGSVRAHIDRCIGCRACETACPSGVPYGELLERGRARLGGPRWIARFFLRRLVGRPWAVRLLAAAGRMAGKLPPRRAAAEWPAMPAEPKGRVALHAGCVTPHVFPALIPDAARLLAHLGYRVNLPADQNCCGALHRHAGIEHRARIPEGYDAVLSPAAGCSTTPGLTDLCRFLLDRRPLAGLRLPPTRVAYDAPCHLLHAQGVDASPLLDEIDGVQRVPLSGAERCCGAGGLYMETQAALARRVRAEKLDAIAASGAEVVATPNPGCMIWLWRGLRARGLPVEVTHPVCLLARAAAYTGGP